MGFPSNPRHPQIHAARAHAEQVLTKWKQTHPGPAGVSARCPSFRQSQPQAPGPGSAKFRRFDVSIFRRFHPKTTQNANRPNTRPPQDLPAKKIACVTICHLRICTTCARPAPRSEPRASASGTRKAGYPIALNANRRRQLCHRPCIFLDPLKCPRDPVPPKLSPISTIRLFAFSTFPDPAPTHARHKSCKRKKSAVSPDVTLEFAARRTKPPRESPAQP